jgi:type IV pilus assembly protein PilQ
MTAASSHTINLREGPRSARRPRTRAALVALAALAGIAWQGAFAQSTPRLEKVELQPQPGEQLEVRLVLDGPAPQPVTFTIDNPARLAVDLPGTTLALDSRRIDVKTGGVDTIVAAEASGRTRLVFNLDQMQPYQTSVAGNVVVVPSDAERRRRWRRQPRPQPWRPRARRPRPRPSKRWTSAAAPTVPGASSSVRTTRASRPA